MGKECVLFLMNSQVPFSSTFSNSQGLVREPNHQPSDSSFPGLDIFAAPTSELEQNQMREERHLQGHAFNQLAVSNHQRQLCHQEES